MRATPLVFTYITAKALETSQFIFINVESIYMPSEALYKLVLLGVTEFNKILQYLHWAKRLYNKRHFLSSFLSGQLPETAIYNVIQIFQTAVFSDNAVSLHNGNYICDKSVGKHFTLVFQYRQNILGNYIGSPSLLLSAWASVTAAGTHDFNYKPKHRLMSSAVQLYYPTKETLLLRQWYLMKPYVKETTSSMNLQ